MKKVDEQIRWYDQNATRKDDDLIKANLKLINNLYEEIENSEDKLFLDKIIGTFCEIIEIQRDVIADTISVAEQGGYYTPSPHNFVQNQPFQTGSPTDDKHLQDAFIYYLTYQTKKKLSSYTINDYCSRLRNLWKSFYKAYVGGELPEELCIEAAQIVTESTLLNVYNHLDVLNAYIGMMSACSEDKRNWANAGAALNKFIEFAQGGE